VVFVVASFGGSIFVILLAVKDSDVMTEMKRNHPQSFCPESAIIPAIATHKTGIKLADTIFKIVCIIIGLFG
jgi:hypothetical protein